MIQQKTEYPPVGSLEWRQRMADSERELRRSRKEIFEHCAKINEAVTQIFHPKTDPAPGASDLVAPTSSATPAQGSAITDGEH